MNITLLVGTCDKYQHIWKYFGELFERYWDKNIEIQKYFLSETKSFDDYGFKSILPGNIPYSDCLKYALDIVDTKYILWMQDDYFLRKKIYKSKFNTYISLMDYGVDRLGIHEDSYLYNKSYSANNFYRLHQFSLYTISMQASIWNKEFFKSCLIPVGSENPWEFEINGSFRLNTSRQHNIVFDKQQEPWYKEAMKKGKFTDDYYKILEEEKLCLQ
jgi:hypothetical protein